MTNQLTSNGLNEHLQRFGNYNDAVIRYMAVEYRKSEADLHLAIDAQDTANKESGWTRITLTLRSCSLIRFVQSSRESYQVLSNGMHIIFAGGMIGIDLGHFVDSPESLNELQQSPCCGVGKDLFWAAAPILS